MAEKAYESDDLRHGVFFHFVIRGLRGEANQARDDKDGTVTVEELSKFTRKRIPDFVKEAYGDDTRQRPFLKSEINDDIPLVVLDSASSAPPGRTEASGARLSRRGGYRPCESRCAK